MVKTIHKTVWQKVMENKVATAAIIAVTLFAVNNILNWTKDRTLEYIDLPGQIQQLEKRIEFIENNYRRK